MLEQKFRQWEQEFIQQGKLEGLAEGKLAGLATQKTTLLEMLADRFGQVPSSWKEAIDHLADAAVIGNLTRSVYKAQGMDEYARLLDLPRCN